MPRQYRARQSQARAMVHGIYFSSLERPCSRIRGNVIKLLRVPVRRRLYKQRVNNTFAVVVMVICRIIWAPKESRRSEQVFNLNKDSRHLCKSSLASDCDHIGQAASDAPDDLSPFNVPQGVLLHLIKDTFFSSRIIHTSLYSACRKSDFMR